jgi:hypothetical protein
MSLVNDAIQAYAKDQLENKEEGEKEKKKFIEDGIQNIKDRFGDNLKIEVISDKEGGVAFLVEELKMRLRRSQGYYNIYLVQKCPKCDTEYEDHIINLKNIGKAIQDGHASYDCEKILKEREPVKEFTTDEKLILALRTFVRENASEWI